MIRRWNAGVIDRAFGEFIALYQMSMFDIYEELWVGYRDGFDRVLDAHLVPWLRSWPAPAQELLIEALGVGLGAFPDTLGEWIEEVDNEPEGVDGIYGHVFRALSGVGANSTTTRPRPRIRSRGIRSRSWRRLFRYRVFGGRSCPTTSVRSMPMMAG